MRPISRPSCLYCHRSSCRRMRTPCFYGLRRSLATRSFGRTWCGGAQIGTVLLPLASSTLRCYSIWTDFMLTDTCFPPSRRIGTCSLALHCIASFVCLFLALTFAIASLLNTPVYRYSLSTSLYIRPSLSLECCVFVHLGNEISKTSCLSDS